MRWTLAETARRQGIGTPERLASLARLDPVEVRALWEGRARIVRVATLDALCLALGVGVGALLVHDPALVLRLSLTERR